MYLTNNQIKWMYEHGDREVADIQTDEKGMYVIMWDGYDKVDKKVYLPKK